MTVSWAIVGALGASLVFLARVGSRRRALGGIAVSFGIALFGFTVSVLQGYDWREVLALSHVSAIGRSIVIGYGMVIGFSGRYAYESVIGRKTRDAA